MTQTDKAAQQPMDEEELVTHSPNERGKWKTLIWVFALMIIGVGGCMTYSHLPRTNDAPNTALDTQLTPTPTASGLVDSIQLNKTVVVDNTQITLKQVQQATSFSDVRKQAGAYTVRIYVELKNIGTQPGGPQYSDVVRLKLADGTLVKTSSINASPELIQNTKLDGSFDFGLSKQANLSDLTLLIADKSISFKSN